MRVRHRVPRRKASEVKLGAAEPDAYAATARSLLAARGRLGASRVPKEASRAHAYMLASLGGAVTSPKDMRRASESAHVCASHEDWSSVRREEFDSVADACLARLWSVPDDVERRHALLSVALVNPDSTLFGPLREYVHAQPAWQRLDQLDPVQLLSDAGLIRAKALGEAEQQTLALAWRAGLATGMLSAIEEL